MSTPTWSSGQIIAGRYRLVKQLGTGGMGHVWQAEHVTLRAQVAIKLIDPALMAPSGRIERDDIQTRFMREAQAAAALRSPHVVQILDHGMDKGVPYMTMELLEGETLADRLDRMGVLAPLEVARTLTHVARAVGKAHEAGIVHRDLKPENIFLVRNDDEEMAKVLDFGIAKLMRSPLDPEGRVSSVTRSGFLVGTPCYMSPEQAQGVKELDGRSDLWAMAVMAYECICGRRPFESEAVGSLVLEICVNPLPLPSKIRNVPAGFDEWWQKAAARNPAERFQTAKEFSETLRAVLAPELLMNVSSVYNLTPAFALVQAKTGTNQDSSRPQKAGAATERGVVWVPSASRSKKSRKTFFGAMILGMLFAAGLGVVLWRATSRPNVAAPGDSANQAATPSEPTATPSLPTSEPSAQPGPSVEAAEPLQPPEAGSTSEPAESATALPPDSHAAHPPDPYEDAPRGPPAPQFTGKKKKDRMGF